MFTRNAFTWWAPVLVCLCAAAAAAPADDLVAALSGADPAARAGAWESAGQYGPEVIPAVARLLDSGDFGIAQAAKWALEKVVGVAVTNEAARSKASAALCDALGAARGESARRALAWYLSYTAGPQDVSRLAPLLAKPETFEVALFALRGAGGRAATEAVLKQLDATTDSTQHIALVKALGDLRDEAAVPALMQLAEAGGPGAPAAIDALGRVGGDDAARFLLRRAQGAPDPAVLAACLKALESQAPDRAAKGYQFLLKRTADPKAVCAALLGFGKTAKSGGAAKFLAARLTAEDVAVRGAAREALLALQGPKADNAITKLIAHADGNTKAGLLEVLQARNPKAAEPFLREAMASDDAALRSAAVRIVAEAPRPEYEAFLLKASREGADTDRHMAMSGYLALAEAAAASGNADKAYQMYRTGLDAAPDGFLRSAALRGLAATPREELLPVLRDVYEAHPEARADVAACAVAVATQIAGAKPDLAKMVFERVLDATPDQAVLKKAAAGLNALGEKVDLVQRRGYISRWLAVGPFVLAEGQPDSTPFPPEQGFSASAKYPGPNGTEIGWQEYVVEDPSGLTELNRLFQPAQNVVAYLRAVVRMPADRQAVLRVGSDDGAVCWINGAKVSEVLGSRGYTAGQDVIPVALRKGENVILLKITQGGGEWRFSARLTDADGNPIPFEN